MSRKLNPAPKTFLYVRVSTVEQTSAHQLIQAREAGFIVEDDDVITDHGVSGVSTRLEDRDQGRRLFDLLRPNDILLCRWVDRLGRDYADVKGVITRFNKEGVTVATIINGMRFDADHVLEAQANSDMLKAARDAMLAFMSALASADAAAKREARQAGIEYVKNSPDRARKYRGKKPSYDRQTYEAVQAMLSKKSMNISQIAREAGLSRQAILRIRDAPASAEAALIKWGL